MHHLEIAGRESLLQLIQLFFSNQVEDDLAQGQDELRATYLKFNFPRVQGEKSVLNCNLYLASSISYHSYQILPSSHIQPIVTYMQSRAIPQFLCRKFYLRSRLCSVKL